MSVQPSLLYYAKNGEIDRVKALLESTQTFPPISDPEVIKQIILCEKACVDLIELLLSKNILTVCNLNNVMSDSDVLNLAHSRFDILEFVIKNSFIDPSFNNNSLIKKLSQIGWYSALEILLHDTRVYPAINECIIIAGNNSNLFTKRILENKAKEIAKLNENTNVLLSLIKGGETECARKLAKSKLIFIPINDTETITNLILSERGPDSDLFEFLLSKNMIVVFDFNMTEIDKICADLKKFKLLVLI